MAWPDLTLNRIELDWVGDWIGLGLGLGLLPSNLTVSGSDGWMATAGISPDHIASRPFPP